MTQTVVRQLGRRDYLPTWQAMQAFTQARTPATADQLWLVEHPPVYTLGLNGRRQHLLAVSDAIPVIHTDRGGQVTYHGPGQVVVYTLLDLRRARLNVRQLVTVLEQAMVTVLAGLGVAAVARPEAPGVYVGGKKIGALGLRVKNQCCYHGLSLNQRMDLAPFAAIDPCGQPGLGVTQLDDLGVSVEFSELAARLAAAIIGQLP